MSEGESEDGKKEDGKEDRGCNEGMEEVKEVWGIEVREEGIQGGRKEGIGREKKGEEGDMRVWEWIRRDRKEREYGE